MASSRKTQVNREPRAKGVPGAAVQTNTGALRVTKSVNAAAKVVVPEPDDAVMPEIMANLLKEYVSGGGFSWLAQGFFRALPQYIDDITADFGDDLYERMMFDPQVAACVNHVKLAVLAHGVRLELPKAIKEDDPRRNLAQEILEFCQRNLEGLDRPLDLTLFELLDGMVFGYKVAEQVYEQRIGGADNGRMCLRALKVKPRRSTAFVVDAYQNTVALLGLLPSQGLSTVVTAGLIGAPSAGVGPGASGHGAVSSESVGFMPQNILPREKFVVFTFRSKDSDPRGTSMLRPAYNAWWLKMQVFPEYLKYLAVFAVASLIGKVSPDAASYVSSIDSDGNVVDGTVVTPEQALLNVLISLRGNSAAALPPGTEVQILQANERGEVFIMAFDFFNREITKAILNQTRATMEAEHGSRADSETGQDVLDMVVRQGKSVLSHTVKADMLRPLVAYNYGASALDLVPDVSLSEMEHQDLAANGTSLAALITAEFFDPESQFPALDAQYGFPQRDVEAWLGRRAEKAAAAAQLLKAGDQGKKSEDGSTGGTKDSKKQEGSRSKAHPNKDASGGE